MHAWLALVTVLAAPVATPVAKPAAPTSAPVTPVKPVDLASAVAAAEATLTAAKLPPGAYDSDGAIARTSGLDPDRLAAQLDALTAACTDPAAVCHDLIPHADVQDRLGSALGWLGTARHAGSLLRSQQRGSFAASQALDRLRSRAMVDALPKARCAPPTTAQLTGTSTELADFYVMRMRAGVLKAEPLTTQERDDLAYFLASVATAGREIGAPAEATRSDPRNPGKAGAAEKLRAELLARLKVDMHAGDVAAAVATGKRYLASLGYPARLDSAADAEYAWGGARHSFVMRDVAELAELTGDVALAYDLYRRADPGGGMCGTSYWSYWQTQVGGAIRSAERLGDCRVVVAERLLDIDVEDSSSQGPPDREGLGTGRLAAAGFDVQRLLRGAMLTLGRHDEAAVRRALEAAPAAIRTAGLARLNKRGREDWGRRVYAIEGTAATGDARTLTALLALLDTLTPVNQARVITTIGEAAQRPEFDPCAPSDGFGFGSSSNVWTREVPMLGLRCESSLTLPQSEALARRLLPLVGHRDPAVDRAAIEALGKLAVQLARPTLRKLARVKPSRPCGDEATCALQLRYTLATEAITALDAAPSDPVWHKYDGKRGG